MKAEDNIHADEPVVGSRGSPEETPSTGRDRRVERTPVERLDPGTETIPSGLYAMRQEMPRSGRKGWNGQSTGCKGKKPPMNTRLRRVVAR